MLENVKKQMHGVPIDSGYPETPTGSSFLDSNSKFDIETGSDTSEREIHSEKREESNVEADVGVDVDADVTATTGKKHKSDEERSRSSSVNLLNEGMESSVSSDLDDEDNENTEYYKSDKERLAEMTLGDIKEPSDNMTNSVITTTNDVNDPLIRETDKNEVMNNNNKRHKPNNSTKIDENTEIITIDDSDSDEEEIEAMDASKPAEGTASNGNGSNGQLVLPDCQC
ncbi:unnamed protein product [[Candida] boidinii]|nr:unnamed protein product [[Candida] boidinii]